MLMKTVSPPCAPVAQLRAHTGNMQGWELAEPTAGPISGGSIYVQYTTDSTGWMIDAASCKLATAVEAFAVPTVVSGLT
jgi:hypothetical protein